MDKQKNKREQVSFTVDTMTMEERDQFELIQSLGPFYELFLDIERRLAELPDNQWLIYQIEWSDDKEPERLLGILKSHYRCDTSRHAPPYMVNCHLSHNQIWIKRGTAWTNKQESDND